MNSNVPLPLQISAPQVKTRLDNGEALFFLDVREPWEHTLANLGGTLIPLGELPRRLSELDPEKEMIVLCHHGVRSAQAVSFLRANGYSRAINLSGGIDRWSQLVDPKVPRY